MSENEEGKNEPNSFDDFYERFVALQEEAGRYYLSSVLVLLEDDSLNNTERTKVSRIRCGPTLAMGMLYYALNNADYQETD